MLIQATSVKLSEPYRHRDIKVGEKVHWGEGHRQAVWVCLSELLPGRCTYDRGLLDCAGLQSIASLLLSVCGQACPFLFGKSRFLAFLTSCLSVVSDLKAEPNVVVTVLRDSEGSGVSLSNQVP